MLTLSAAPALAQFIGFTAPQSTQQTLATSVACTGSPQNFAINNLGQVQHFLSVSSVGTQTLTAQIQGLDRQANSFAISDRMLVPSSGGVVYGAGYFPRFQAVIICTPGTGTFTLSYSGAWGSSGLNSGSFLTAAIDKQLFSGVPGNANFSTGTFQSPFGVSGGTLYFQFFTAVSSGATLTVSCQQQSLVAPVVIFTATLNNVTTLQSFPVPNLPCVFPSVTYNNTGAAGTATAEYVFASLGMISPAGTYTHVTGTTATVAKGTPGFLHTVTINLGGAGTLSVFDLPAASCTGTPATNQVAIITATATTLQTFSYDVSMLQGICVKSSVAMDYTVSSQ
jgi:hypothetical protein